MQEFTPLHLQAQSAANSVKAALTRVAAEMGGHDTERAMQESAHEVTTAVDLTADFIRIAVERDGLRGYAETQPLAPVQDAAQRTMDKLEQLESVNRGSAALEDAKAALIRLGDILNDQRIAQEVLMRAVGESV